MGNRISSLFMVGLLLVGPATAGQGFDPGVPDTLALGSATIGVGISTPLLVRVVNDHGVDAFAFGVEFTTSDSGVVRFDSVGYVGRMADPSILSQRIVNARSADGSLPDSILLAMLKNVSDPLMAGNGAVLAFYFTGVHPGLVSIDTVCIRGTCADFVSPTMSEYSPVVTTGSIEVVASSLPPVLSFSEESPLVTTTGGAVDFSVAVVSPPGYPTELELVSFASWDDPSIQSSSSPSLDSNGDFSWTPGVADVGIWRATFVATDSSGLMNTAEVQIQVVASPRYLLGLDAVETTDAPVAANLVHGDFNNDGSWDLLATGMSTTTSFASSAYVHSGDGSLQRIQASGPGSFDRNTAVGYVDGDDYVDAVLFHDNLLRVLRGGTPWMTPLDAATNTPGFLRDGALIDFNGDAHLDYACASLMGCAVYLGGEDATFQERTWIVQNDSVLSVNSADFNGDGFDDLALGTTGGLRVLLCDGLGGFVEGGSYAQEFGSVDVEVTTRGADFNGDMLFDICLASPSKGGQYSDLYVYLGESDGTFEPVPVRRVLGQIFAALPGDFNGDADLDLAYLNGAGGYVAVVFGDGAGGFANELRYPVPKYTPRKLDCLDLDLDGDLDLVVVSYLYGLETKSSLFVFLNQTDPDRISRQSLDIRADNNVDIDLIAPSGARLNRVCNSVASGELRLCDADRDDRIDIRAACRTTEAGRYDLIATPRNNAEVGAPFSLQYSIDGRTFRLVENRPSNGRYVFPLYPAGESPLQPVQGSCVSGSPVRFTWPDQGETILELALDLDFVQVIHTASVSAGSYALPSSLPLADSTPYYWRVRSQGHGADDEVCVFIAVASPTGMDTENGEGKLPISYLLEQNQPNPFNPVTDIRYSIPAAAEVRITVYNVLGQSVAVLVDRTQAAGTYSVNWDATDSQGREVASGIYFYRLQSGDFLATRKMVLLR